MFKMKRFVSAALAAAMIFGTAIPGYAEELQVKDSAQESVDTEADVQSDQLEGSNDTSLYESAEDEALTGETEASDEETIESKADSSEDDTSESEIGAAEPESDPVESETDAAESGEDTTESETDASDVLEIENSNGAYYDQQFYMTQEVNALRAKEGINMLALSMDLSEAAMLRAEECQTLFSHTRPDGTLCFTVLSEFNISYGAAGENIAMGYTSVDDVVDGWWNSSGHRKNMMSSSYEMIGIGIAGSSDLTWVQLFTGGYTVKSMALQGFSSSYELGTDLADQGAYVSVIYSNGKTGIIPVIDAMLSSYDSSVAGTKTITVTCNGKTMTKSITFKHTQHSYGTPIYTWSSNTVCAAQRTCKYCGNIQKESVTATGKVTQNATCTLPQLTQYTATFSNSAFVTQTKSGVQTKAALGHAYASSYTTDKAATCTTAGSKSRHCTRSGCTAKTGSTTIAATGHSYGTPTYTWSSNTVCVAQRKCKICGNVQKESVAATGKVTQNVTCTLPQLTQYTATFSNSAFKTQTKSGVQTKAALGHAYASSYTTDKAATCTTAGSKSRHCTRSGCTAKTGSTTIAATGHSYGTPTYTWSSNTVCVAQRKCKTCGNVQKESVTATGKVTRNATCTLPQLTQYTATFSNSAFKTQTKSGVQTKAALGHAYASSYTTDKAATCTTAGSKSRHCTRSGCTATTDVTSVPMTNHISGDWIVDSQATYNNTGSRHKACTQCGKVLETEVIPKLESKEEIARKGVQDFVRRLYENILERNADQGGLDAWTYVLTSGRESGAKVAQGFVDSVEFKARNLSDTEYLTILYKTFLNRDPDAGGIKAWQEVLDTGFSRTYVLRGFAESDEFKKICDSYGIIRGSIDVTEARDQNDGVTRFVSRAYRLCLQRTPDAEGLNNWCEAILSGRSSVKEVAYGFVYSEEFENRGGTIEEFLTTMYRLFLDREPDNEGYNQWLKKLYHSYPRYLVVEGFADSEEFKALCASYGL